jgi:NAD dependent epimerase/dehydratase
LKGRVLVTGAAGFIGSHLVEALVRSGASVRGFVRYNSRNDHGWLETADAAVIGEVDIYRGDFTSPETAIGAVEGCDVVMHLGALIPIPYSYRHPREFVTANVTGTLNILEAVRRTDVRRVVHVSTSEVYGTALRVPIDEDHPLQAQSPYAASKIGADQIALSYQRSFETPIVVARPFNTFGPRQSARAVIPTIVTQALTRGEIELGATTPTRDFVYVADTVEGLIRCGSAEGVEGEVINLGTGVEVSIGDVAAQVQRVLGSDLPVRVASDRLRPPGSEVERLLADASKAKGLLDWEAQVSFSDGLEQTIDWMRNSVGAYKPTVYNV